MATAHPNSVRNNLDGIRRRIEAACLKVDRQANEVTLIAVSKRQPVERLRQALEAGHRTLGENQVQEARGKADLILDDVDWHLIGPLQSNKVKSAAGLFNTIHSVDRPKIARKLSQAATQQGRRIQIFIQINVGAEDSKSGFHEADLEENVRPLFGLESLDVVGLMAIPPLEPDAESSRRWFVRLRELRDQVMAWPEWAGFPGWLSMGMSRDFEIAIEEGATHVRVGTAIFGNRGD